MKSAPIRTASSYDRLPATPLPALARADAFASLGLSRRDVLWAVRGFSDAKLPLLDGPGELRDLEPKVALPALTLGEQVVDDYGSFSMSLRSHPLALLRPRLAERGVSPTEVLKASRNEDEFVLAGLVLVRQRPGTASGVVFVTIEDEHGIANLVVWPKVFEAHRRIVMGSRLLGVRDRLRRSPNEPTAGLASPAVPDADIDPIPATMFLTKSSWPGTSTMPTWYVTGGVTPAGEGSCRWAKPRSIVMPRCFSAGRRSVSTPVRARTRAVLP